MQPYNALLNPGLIHLHQPIIFTSCPMLLRLGPTELLKDAEENNNTERL